jgi:hypothetical protein
MNTYLGYLESALVLCTFRMKTMMPLRIVALASNRLAQRAQVPTVPGDGRVSYLPCLARAAAAGRTMACRVISLPRGHR